MSPETVGYSVSTEPFVSFLQAKTLQATTVKGPTGLEDYLLSL